MTSGFFYCGLTYTAFKWQTMSNIYTAEAPGVSTGAATEITALRTLGGLMDDLAALPSRWLLRMGLHTGKFMIIRRDKKIFAAGDFSAQICGLESGSCIISGPVARGTA
jgi:hypothetical protein